MGYIGIQPLARVIRVELNHDARPDDPLQLTYEEFAAGVEVMRRVGFPLNAPPRRHGVTSAAGE